MQKTIFKITQMDCPSEENLIRMKLDGISGIKNLDFESLKANAFVPSGFHQQGS